MHRTREVFREHRRSIFLTYSLTLLEIGFELLYPFAIGLAINGMLKDEWLLVAVLPVIWSSHVVCGYLRQRFDTRLFTSIYSRIASSTVLEQRAAGQPTSETVARTGMASEVVDFLEHDVPESLFALISLVGSAALLCAYDLAAGLMMSALLVPAAILYGLFGRAAFRYEGRINDRSEREVDVVARANEAGVRRHFRQLSRWKVRLSDREARTWSSMEIFSLGVFLAVLYRLTDIPGLMAGDIFAAVAYSVAMIDAFDTFPERIGSISRMAENIRRLS